MNICKYCDEETYNPKYCNNKCSALDTTPGRKHKLDTKIKISKALGGKGIINNNSFCLNCGIKLQREYNKGKHR